MKTTDNNAETAASGTGADFFDSLWEESWTYIKTVVDIVREPVLILDKELHVMVANDSFYRTFQVEAKDTEHKLVYDLGDGQWNIPALRKLLDEILPKNTFFKGFEVIHKFPTIGRKVMILNARQIHSKKFPPIILLAMEDVTEMMAVAETLAGHANAAELRFAEKTQKLETHIGKLEQEINDLKKKIV
jgi:nitrogen-specific signal transduction histidine kinase